ncbi:MAG: hypothetical protein MUF71_02550 [Candidatus Kapabacteria bacterium]|nr:hypothetical protein [Candidatus Kapabacteria bacterium]
MACFLVVAFVAPMLALPVSAQELPQSSPNITEQRWTPQNRLSTGVGVMGIVGGNKGALSLSAMYSRTLLPLLEVEIAFQKAGSSSFYQYISPSPNSIDQYNLSFWDATVYDATLLFSPFRSGILSGLRIGAGATVQNLQRGMVREYPYSSGAQSLNPTIKTYPPSYYSYEERLSLGGNLKLDYVFPLTQMLDLGIRTQAQVLLYRLNDEPVRVFADGAASIGVFLSVKF